MAKFDGKFIRGLVGSVIFRKYKDKQIVQGVSKNKVKQQPGSKAASSVFGKSSNFGSYIRAALDPLITNYYDGGMSARFNGELLFSLRSALIEETQTFDFKPNSFNRLAGFEFNINSPLKNNFFVQPVVGFSGNQLQIAIPEMHLPQDLKFPTGVKFCKMIVGTAMFDLTYGHFDEAEFEVLDFEYNYHPETIPAQQLTFDIEPGCLCITAISLRFYERTFIGDTYINDKNFNPSAVLSAVIAEGEVNNTVTKNWQGMDFKNT